MPRLAAPDRLEPREQRASCFQQLLAQLSWEYEDLQQQNGSLRLQLREHLGCSPKGSPRFSPRCSPRSQCRGAVAKLPAACSTWRSGLAETVAGSTASISLPGASPRRRRRSLAALTVHSPDRNRRVSFASGHTPPRRFSRSSSVGQQRRSSRRVSCSLEQERSRLLAEQFGILDVNQTGRLFLEDFLPLLAMGEEAVDHEGLLALLQTFSEEEDASEAGKEPGIGLAAFVLLMDDSKSFPQLEPRLQAALEKLRSALRLQVLAEEDEVVLLSSIQPKKVRDATSIFWWEVLPTAVIMLNAALTGLSTDLVQYDKLWEGLEAGFAAFYTIEFLSKIKAFGTFWYFWGPEWRWNIFDFGCLVASLADLAVEHLWSGSGKVAQFTMIKIFRLARLGRLIRTLRFKAFQELKLMVFGVLSGLRVLTWAVVLLVLLIYLVGVGMTSVMGAKEPEFETVVSSMFTLFRCWTDGCAAYDGTPLPERLRRDYGLGYLVFHILLTMFVTVGVFNLIMAIFVDNVVNAQQLRRMRDIAEKSRGVEMKLKRQLIKFVNQGVHHQEDAKRRTFMDHAREKISTSLRRGSSEDVELDKDLRASKHVNREWDALVERKVLITREVFRDWLEDEDFQHLLDEAEIEMTSYFELFDVLDADMGGLLSMDELITGLMQLRGPMTKSDVVAVRLMVEHLTKAQEEED